MIDITGAGQWRNSYSSRLITVYFGEMLTQVTQLLIQGGLDELGGFAGLAA